MLHIESLQALNPVDFEHLIKALLDSMGFSASTTKATGDGGIDVIAFNEQPIIGGKYVIQCKKYATGNNVGESAVRDLYGVMHAENANKGILITTADFSKQAFSFSHDKAIELINGESLLYLIYKYLPDVFEKSSFDAVDEPTMDLEGSLKNEPTDFRGIEWGSNRGNHRDMVYIREGGMGGSQCNRVGDSKKMGSATIESPIYFFDEQDRFYSVHILYYGKANYEELLRYLFKKYGKPYDSGGYDHSWSGKTVQISLQYQEDSSLGYIAFEYLPLWNEVQESHKRKVAIKKNIGQKSQCFVATAIYGAHSPEVSMLRRWRDSFLVRNLFGRGFINLYYKIGPGLASYVGRRWLIKRAFRMAFDVFTRVLKRKYA